MKTWHQAVLCITHCPQLSARYTVLSSVLDTLSQFSAGYTVLSSVSDILPQFNAGYTALSSVLDTLSSSVQCSIHCRQFSAGYTALSSVQDTQSSQEIALTDRNVDFNCHEINATAQTICIII